MDLSKKTLRPPLIQQRKSLTKKQVDNAEKKLCYTARLNQKLYKILNEASVIFSYCAFNNEISPYLLTQELSADIYLPKITNYSNSEMAFFSTEQAQTINKYGIAEPKGNSEPIGIYESDILLMPLVGFDSQGNRLGMGAGFYDRAIEKAKQINSKTPLLIGLAYDFQQIDTITSEVWDVPLDVILTDQRVIDPKNQLAL